MEDTIPLLYSENSTNSFSNKRYRLLRLFKKSKDCNFSEPLRRMLGFKPSKLALYYLAMRHSSVALKNKKGYLESNERLEYLGDAVLGLAVAEYLFNKYPCKNEGFLSEIRSRIVNRESLNRLAKKIGLSVLIQYNGDLKAHGQAFKSIYGNALEALVGAIYIDKGYKTSKNFIFKKLIMPLVDLDHIINTTTNYKSKMIEWTQKNSKSLQFEVSEIECHKHFKKFEAKVVIDKKAISEGIGLSKKKAEQHAAKKAFTILNIE